MDPSAPGRVTVSRTLVWPMFEPSDDAIFETVWWRHVKSMFVNEWMMCEAKKRLWFWGFEESTLSSTRRAQTDREQDGRTLFQPRDEHEILLKNQLENGLKTLFFVCVDVTVALCVLFLKYYHFTGHKHGELISLYAYIWTLPIAPAAPVSSTLHLTHGTNRQEQRCKNNVVL